MPRGYDHILRQQAIKLWTTASSTNVWKQITGIHGSPGRISYLDQIATGTTSLCKYWQIEDGWSNAYSEWSTTDDASSVHPMNAPDQLRDCSLHHPVNTPVVPQILIHKDSKEARAATERARTLLKSILTTDQWREYERDGTFTISSQSGQRYRLNNKSRVRNITRLGTGNVAVEYLCCHPVDDVPIEDVLITQKLHLECAEESFRRTANITPVTRDPHRVF